MICVMAKGVMKVKALFVTIQQQDIRVRSYCIKNKVVNLIMSRQIEYFVQVLFTKCLINLFFTVVKNQTRKTYLKKVLEKITLSL